MEAAAIALGSSRKKTLLPFPTVTKSLKSAFSSTFTLYVWEGEGLENWGGASLRGKMTARATTAYLLSG